MHISFTILSCSLHARSLSQLSSEPVSFLRGHWPFLATASFFCSSPMFTLRSYYLSTNLTPPTALRWHWGREKSWRRTTQTKKPLILKMVAILDDNQNSYATHNWNPLLTSTSRRTSPSPTASSPSTPPSRRLMSAPCASTSCRSVRSPPLSLSRPNFSSNFILPENLLCRLLCLFPCNWVI